MFTSEPSLTQRIERMIVDTPVVDGYSRVRCDQPGAPDLASLISEPGLKAELISVGMAPGDLDPALPPEDRVRLSIPYLKRMRNTATAWCLFRIFRDLYDFDEPQLTEANHRDLLDKVTRSASDPAWPSSVLRDRCNIRAVVTSLSHQGADASKNPDSFYYRLDAQPLVAPSIATDHVEALGEILGERPTSAEALEHLIDDWLDRTVTGRVRFTSVVLPIERRFRSLDAGTIDGLLAKGGEARTTSDDPVAAIGDQVAYSILKWHHENRKTVQIAVDGDGPSFPRFQGDWTSEMARAFHRFGNARFDLLMGSDLLAQDAAVLAGRLPNVYSSGDWSPTFVPIMVEKKIGFRLQVAPMTKVGGFLSNASSVEWCYGKLQVVRKAMGVTLASMVEARFFEEDEIPFLLRQILHDTPRDLFDLFEK